MMTIFLCGVVLAERETTPLLLRHLTAAEVYLNVHPSIFCADIYIYDIQASVYTYLHTRMHIIRFSRYCLKPFPSVMKHLI